MSSKDYIYCYQGSALRVGSGNVVVGETAVPPVAPRTMRFDFKYDHFNPITELRDHSADGLIWTHVKRDVYDFHYDNPIWSYQYLNHSNAKGLFDIYKFASIYPMSNHQFDVIDSNLTGVTVLNRFFQAGKQVINCVLKNTGDVTDASSLFFSSTKCRLVSINSLDFSSVLYIDDMFRLCSYLESPLDITLSGAVISCNSSFFNTIKVPSGALSLYNSLSSQTTPPTSHTNTFTSCGLSTVTGAAELAQIPTDWGGNYSGGDIIIDD